jgi:succinate-semialdehyde dehydrogenase/glutarate-semialdehyde dehydrogenase
MVKMLEVTNPANNEVLGQVKLKTAQQIKEMVIKSKEAQIEWESITLTKRGDILYKLADILIANKDTLARTNTLEMGKPFAQSVVECLDAANLLKGCVQRAKHLYGEVLADNVPGMENDLWFTKREAIGVVCCIIPFNFPIELTFQKLAPALTMGNACLVKAPSSNPLAVTSLEKYAKEAGIPDGVVQFFVAERGVVAESIIENPLVQAIAMTGSSATGVELMRSGALTLKRLFFELGGNDPLIIFDDVEPAKAVQEIMAGRVENNGQVCCASKRFIIQKGIIDAVTTELQKAIKEWKIGDPFDEDTVISTLVSEKEAKTVEEQVNFTVKQGAKLIYGGKRTGARYEPTILTEVSKEMDIAKDLEIFGPVFPLIAFDAEEEAIEIANSSVYGLSSGVMSADMNRAFRVAKQVKAGAVIVNGSGCYRHYDQPFGGPKMTGIGREGISVTLEEYSDVKTYAYKGAFA